MSAEYEAVLRESCCQYHGCTDPAVESCAATDLFGNPCVTLRCAEHRCTCPNGTRSLLDTAMTDGDGDGGR